MKADTITFETLVLEKVISSRAKKAKIVATGKLSKAVTIQGSDKLVAVSQGAQAKIEAAGGNIQLNK